jgi:hypothetical protein
VSVDPEALAAAFAHFDSRGVLHGDAEFNHAATMRTWASDVWAYVGEKEAEVEAARRSVARADTVVRAVQAALDATDPDQPEALRKFARAVGGLLELTPRPSPTPRKLEVAS